MTTPGRQQIFAFVLATKDDHLWMNWWDGSQWAWVDHVGPPGWVGGQGFGAPGGIVAHGSWPPNMSLLHLGKDGRLWARAWDLAKWTWNDLGPWPSAPILTFSVGATLYKGRRTCSSKATSTVTCGSAGGTAPCGRGRAWGRLPHRRPG
jgi:hypothetical protein